MTDGRGRPFGVGLGVGIVLGVLFGSVVVALVGDEAAEAVRSFADRVLRRGDRVRFEALLQ